MPPGWGSCGGLDSSHTACTSFEGARGDGQLDSHSSVRAGLIEQAYSCPSRSHNYMMAQSHLGGQHRHRQDEAYDLQKVTQPDPPPPLSRAHRELLICHAARLPSAIASMRITARPTIAPETASTMMTSSHATSALLRSEHRRRGLQVPDGAWQRVADDIVPQQEADAVARRLARSSREVTALEEMEAELHKDADFEGDRVAATRLKRASPAADVPPPGAQILHLSLIHI